METLPTKQTGCSMATKQADRDTLMPDPEVSARQAGLRYVSDDEPGIRRKKWGRGFTYLDPEGDHITDEEERERLEELAIPPAWTDVWICPHKNGHLLVTGRDDKGRKQYIYHPAWQEVRSRAKFDRLIPFGEALPQIRARCMDDLHRDGLPRHKVLAAAVRLLDCTLIRVGNDQYAKRNKSYGLTTLRDRHVSFSEKTCTFEFTGKSGQEHHVELNDPSLAHVVERCRDVPGYDLFQYYDEEQNHHTIDSGDVNDYLKETAGLPITAKDFRTWGGTLQAAVTLDRFGSFETEKEAKQNISQVIEEVAERLGNTKAVCRQYYIHPDLFDAYRDRQLLSAWRELLDDESDPQMAPEEHATLQILRRLRGD